MILLFGFFYILELLVERSSQAKEIKEAGGKENWIKLRKEQELKDKLRKEQEFKDKESKRRRECREEGLNEYRRDQIVASLGQKRWEEIDKEEKAAKLRSENDKALMEYLDAYNKNEYDIDKICNDEFTESSCKLSEKERVRLLREYRKQQVVASLGQARWDEIDKEEQAEKELRERKKKS